MLDYDQNYNHGYFDKCWDHDYLTWLCIDCGKIIHKKNKCIKNKKNYSEKNKLKMDLTGRK